MADCVSVETAIGCGSKGAESKAGERSRNAMRHECDMVRKVVFGGAAIEGVVESRTEVVVWVRGES